MIVLYSVPNNIVEKITRIKSLEIIIFIHLTIFFSLVAILLIFQKGLKNVFDEAILAALEPPEPVRRRRCTIL